jgi:hypothetical protein
LTTRVPPPLAAIENVPSLALRVCYRARWLEPSSPA